MALLFWILPTVGSYACAEPKTRSARQHTDKSTPSVSDSPIKQNSAGIPTLVEFYDALKQNQRMQTFIADQLCIDFFHPSSQQYALGGWKTGIVYQNQQKSRSYIEAPSAYLYLPPLPPSAKRLSIDMRYMPQVKLSPELHWDNQILDLEIESIQGGVRLHAAIPSPQNNAHKVHLLTLRTKETRQHWQSGRWAELLQFHTFEQSARPKKIADCRLANTKQEIPLSKQQRIQIRLRLPPQTWISGVADAPTSLRLSTGSLDHAQHRQLHWKGNAFYAEIPAETDSVTQISLEATSKTNLSALRLGYASTDHSTTAQATNKSDSSKATGAKNVIVFLIDTLRADKLRAFNTETIVQTPGIDALAQQAVVLHNAHAQENWTKPSVATLLSSLMPWEHGAIKTESVVANSVQLMPEYLRKHGFFTGAFIANGYVSDKFGFRQGWNTYRNYIREGRRTRAKFVAEDTLAWLDNRPQDKRFFLYVHTIDPHVPYRRTQYLSNYDPDPYEGVVDFSKDHTLLEKIKIGKIELNPRDKKRLEALYNGEVQYHDEFFSKIIAGLKSRKLYDDTLIVVTADHGEEFWDHGSVGHGHNVHEELLHVPLLFAWPEQWQTRRDVYESIGLVDVLPTIIETLGLPPLGESSGHSFYPLLEGKHQFRPATVSGFMEGWRTAVIGAHKIIHRSLSEITVFDLQKDPLERQDLSKGNPQLQAFMQAEMALRLYEQQGSEPRSTKHSHRQTQIDPDTEAQLRALGYVGSSRR